MRADDPNLPHLRRIAEALGELREQVVFVGGAVAGLLVTDPLAESVRATRDVDAVVNADWLLMMLLIASRLYLLALLYGIIKQEICRGLGTSC